MSGGYDTNLFVENVDKFCCPFCFNVLKDPRQCSTGHTFCFSCISEYLKNSNKCPLCEEHLVLNKMGKNLFVKEIINELVTFCPSKSCCSLELQTGDNSCSWIGPLYSQNTHINKDCGFFVIKCPHEMCDVQLQRRFIPNHLSFECSFTHTACILCNKSHVAKSYHAHNMVCIKRPFNPLVRRDWYMMLVQVIKITVSNVIAFSLALLHFSVSTTKQINGCVIDAFHRSCVFFSELFVRSKPLVLQNTSDANHVTDLTIDNNNTSITSEDEWSDMPVLSEIEPGDTFDHDDENTPNKYKKTKHTSYEKDPFIIHRFFSSICRTKCSVPTISFLDNWLRHINAAKATKLRLCDHLCSLQSSPELGSFVCTIAYECRWKSLRALKHEQWANLSTHYAQGEMKHGALNELMSYFTFRPSIFKQHTTAGYAYLFSGTCESRYRRKQPSVNVSLFALKNAGDPLKFETSKDTTFSSGLMCFEQDLDTIVGSDDKLRIVVSFFVR
jgi:hypothetical protein